MGPESLARWGAWLGRHPWRVVGAWLVLLALALPLAGQLQGRLRTETTAIAGTDTAFVEHALAHDFVEPPGEFWIVAWHGPEPALAHPAAVRAAAERLRALPGVKQVLAPTDAKPDARLLATDGRGACLLITPRENTAPALKAVRDAVAPLKTELTGASVAVTGAFPLGHDLNLGAGADSQRAEQILIGPVLLLLLLVFGSPIAAGLPLLLALAAGILAFAMAALVAPYIAVNAYLQTVVSMLGLALGIDYALLITARFRERRAAGDEPVQAAAATLGSAGWTVACAGGVVVASLAALLPVGLLDARSVGMGGVLVVLAAVALALGLLPALLVLAAPWLDWPRKQAKQREAPRWLTWGQRVMAARWVAAPIALLGLLWLASPLAGFKAGVPDMRFYPAELEAVHGIDLLRQMGRSGWTDPVQVVVRRTDQGPIIGPGGLRPLLDLSRIFHADPDVGEVLSPVDLAPGLSPLHYAALWARPEQAKSKYPGLKALVSKDGKSAVFQLVTTNDSDVAGAVALTERVRALATPGLKLYVGGLAAQSLDFRRVLADALPMAIGGLLLASALIMGFMFRSVMIPVKAISLNLLVVAASLGSLVWIFQDGHGAQLLGVNGALGTLPMVIPLLVFCLTFGLSMDYEIFMIGRVREERALGGGEEGAITRGLAATGWVIVAAAGIMVLVCGAFVGAQMIFVKLFGAGMAIAILLDVTVVRLVLAPALLAIAGEWNWWPGVKPGEIPGDKKESLS